MSFVTRSGRQFRLDGRDFKYVGVNHYPLIISSMSRSSVRDFFLACKTKDISVVRTWCFLEYFRYLNYPLGTNLISNSSLESNSNGWTLQTGITRSNEDSHDGTWGFKQVTSSGFNGFYTDSIAVTANTDYTLTFWYKPVSRSGAGPLLSIENGDRSVQIKDCGFLQSTAGEWVRKQVNFNSGEHTTVSVYILNWNGNVVYYYDDFCLNLQGTPSLAENTAMQEQLDMVLDEAHNNNIKLVLSLADNPTYLSKKTYCEWANEIYGSGLSTTSPYIGFFTSDDCAQIYDDIFEELATRPSSITGRTLLEEDAIFSYEAGNELRLDRDDPSGVNSTSSANITLLSKPGGWADERTTHIKTVDPNHLVTYGAMSHTYQWTEGDTVSNGSYYGVDYRYLTALPNVDYLDFHIYPTQAGDGTQLMKYGQRLGYPNAISGNGFWAQIKDYVDAAIENNKPAVCSEIGFPKEVVCSNQYLRLSPRHVFAEEFMKRWFAFGGNAVIWWHGEKNSGGSYSIALDGWNGNLDNVNSDDRPFAKILMRYNHYGKRTPVHST